MFPGVLIESKFRSIHGLILVRTPSGFVASGGQSSGHDEVPRVRPEGPERQPDASPLAESVDVRFAESVDVRR